MPTTVENLTIPNFLQNNILEELELSADAAPGQPTITVINVDGVADGDYLVLLPGAESSELRQIHTSGIVGQTITLLSNLLIQHRNHERVIKLYGNQIQIWRSPNIDGTIPDDSTFVRLGGATSIEPDQDSTLIVDPAGGNGYWYKFTYHNEEANTDTDLSYAEAVRGGGWGNYVSTESIRYEAGLDKVKQLQNSQIAERRAEAEDEINGGLVAAGYVVPLQTQAGIPYVPPLVRNIDRLLSAGLILMQNFGTTKPGSAKDGGAKCTLARAMLAEIQLNDKVLIDSTGQLLAKAELLSGWPDDTTATYGTDGVHGEPSAFTMDKKF